MIDCISVENMRMSDAYTIENSVSGAVLMYRAAYGVYLAGQWKEPVAIVCGSGNNGGDGFALACILQEKGIRCRVFTLSDKRTGDSGFYAENAVSSGVVLEPFQIGCLDGFATVVDCLLGTGFQGKLRDSYRSAIRDINNSQSFVISVDINSGMNGDTGLCELAVISDLTVTIGYIKKGLVTENAGNYMKKLVCTDIGITLVREEEKICSADLPQEGCIPCPAWLDMEIILSCPSSDIL